jgi:SAM-dependent methyltransferase
LAPTDRVEPPELAAPANRTNAADPADPVEPGGPDHWFEPIAEHLGSAYLRYSFTKGTDAEVAFLVDALALEPGMRVLDVGCGPGRHAHALGQLGLEVVGVDISARFIEVARATTTPGVSFGRADARALRYDHEFDAAISLCQGAFGLTGGGNGSPLAGDTAILGGMARALRPGGRLAVSAFSAYFQVRYLEEADRFDAATGVNHEHTEVRDPTGAIAPAELWTTCFTPRELRLLAQAVGLVADQVWSVAPGDYRRRPPDLEHPELLLLAHLSSAADHC